MRSIIAMIESARPCLEIAQQLQAVESAIRAAKKTLIHDHIDHCLDQAVDGSKARASDRRVQTGREVPLRQRMKTALRQHRPHRADRFVSALRIADALAAVRARRPQAAVEPQEDTRASPRSPAVGHVLFTIALGIAVAWFGIALDPGPAVYFRSLPAGILIGFGMYF